MSKLSRRAFLTGIGGATLALPWLESIHRGARANNDGGPPRYCFIMRTGNGVQQADNGEPDRFWPTQTGPLDTSTLRSRDAGRTAAELADWADRLLLVKGTNMPFAPTTCGHAQGGNQLLTAAQISDGFNQRTLALGESIDNRIARAFPTINGGEPLTLYTGPRGGYLDEVLSYRGPEDLRAAEDDPYTAYRRLLGANGGSFDPELDRRRTSVNDLVREQMQALLSRDLSTRDRQRLDTHFQAIREFELATCQLDSDLEQQMATLAGQGTLNDNRIAVAKLHMDLVALAFSCDLVRVATLQVGDGNDGTEYTINGTRLPRFHFISHRVYSDGATGDAIPDADLLHHDIDNLHAQTFLHMVERLEAFGILDASVAVWTSDLGAGVSHTYNNIPWVMVGGANGALQTGQYVDLGGVTHNRLLNTLGTAVGVRKADGSPLDDFGDPSLTGGLIDSIMT